MRRWPMLVLVWTAFYVTAALLLAWSRAGQPAFLALAAVSAAATAVLYFRCYSALTRHALLNTAFFSLLLGLFAAVPIAWRLQRLGADWQQLQERHAIDTRAELDRRLNALIERGNQAADQAAIANRDARRVLFAELERLRLKSKVDALAVFGDSGELYAWAGEHRGRIPNNVRSGMSSIQFVEGPLYSYLYFVRPHASGSGRVAAAILLDAALPIETTQSLLSEAADPFIGSGAAFLPGPGGPEDWSLVIGGDTLLHARLEPASQSEWRDRLLRLAQRFEVAVAMAALLLLAIAWFREPLRPPRLQALVPFLGAGLIVTAAPIGGATDLQDLFSPGLFLLPGPGTVSLGTLMSVLLCAGFFVSTVRPRPRYRSSMLFIALAVLVVALLPILVQVLIGPAGAGLQRWAASTPTLLQGGAPLWAGLQFTVVLLLAITFTFVLMMARWRSRMPPQKRHRAMLLLLLSGLGSAGVFGLVVLALGRTREQVNPYLTLLWIIPVILTGFGAAAYQRDGRRLIRWLCAGWIAASVTLPYVWIAEVNTRLATAERELRTLGIRPDPYLEFLLRHFGREAIARREAGEDGLQLLYRSWVASGLAQEAYPSRITIWDSAGRPNVQLPLGDAFSGTTTRLESVPPYLAAAFGEVQAVAHPEVFSAPEAEQVSQVLVVPLDDGRMITVEVPPRRTFDRASVIAPLLGVRNDSDTRLELVEVGERTVGRTWRPVPDGWRSESVVHFPEGTYHAHLELRTPPYGVQVARGVLIIAANLLIMLLLWAAGRFIRSESIAPAAGWFGWLNTFRSRVTAALFLFFLLPTILFGWVAYSALARVELRAARVVAERAAKRAVNEFPDANGDLRELAAHADDEVLLYFQGELGSASSPEALELGVYNVWMPPEVFINLDSGEEEAGVAPRTIAGQQFITAFRRLQPAGTGTMAVPVSLESGETILRQREMAHLVLFAALVGGLLSFALSVLVGRALAGPIGRLQRAAAAIGAGRLNVQLPEQTGDEFGRLYASFNRMVRRLRRARAQEVRSARVLAWGEMARQVAHEIKNPLTPIKLAVQHLRRASASRRPDFEQVLEQSVDQILIEIDRLTDIARAFSRYGAPIESAGPLETVNVAKVVHEALTLYRTGDVQRQYIADIDPQLPDVFARSGELKEVLLNLIENARDATDPGGRVLVVARRVDQAVELCIEDDGMGIPPDQLTRIFDPHFSTRTTGTGLGLPIVRRLVESWGGTVVAESETGRGTTIRVRLNAALEAAD